MKANNVNAWGVVLTLLVSLFANNANAADQSGRYNAIGSRTCGMFLDEKSKKGSIGILAIDAWMAGYVTAVNAERAETYDILGKSDLQSLSAWMENYCRSKPLSDLAAGMDVLIEVLYPSRKRTGPAAQ